MDLNPIHHLSPGKKMKCSYFDYVQLLMLARLVNGLKPHPPPLSSQKKWSARFWIMFTSDDLPAWLMNLNLICHPSPTKKMKCWIFDYVQLLMISQAGQLTQSPSASPLQPIKWNASFWIMFTSDDQPGWLMDSNPICHPSPANKMKCSFFDYVQLWWSAGLLMDSNPIHHNSPAKNMKCYFLDYVQLLMIGWAGKWTQNPSATPLQPIKWNASFWIVFTSDDKPGWLMDSNPICHPSPAKKWNASFWITFNFWWLAGLVNGLKPHPPPLSSQRNEMLIFGLRSTSDDQLGWLMDSNPIHHPSPANKMKCSFFDYVQLLMIGWAGHWIQTPSASSLQPKK